jgi:hypothetical protein
MTKAKNNNNAILQIDNLQSRINDILLGMTVGELLGLRNGHEKMATTRSTARAVQKAEPRKPRRRREFGPLQPRIERLLKGATSEWHTMADIAKASGCSLPTAFMPRGYKTSDKKFPPVLEWNGQHARAARYRLRKKVG